MDWQKTLELIPDGVQTMSKRPSQYIEGVYPYYIDKGEGAYVYDHKGNKYIDYPCGLGAILLGHAYPATMRAAIDRLERGHLFPLPNYLETELAEKLREIIPCAEMSRFLKSGSEACTAAIKIARAYTGKNVILSSGYHGWHPVFSIAEEKHAGVIDENGYYIKKIDHEDSIAFCNELRDRDDIAAVIIEPYIYSMPNLGFWKNLRRLCTQKNAVLIFDEIITGFRTPGCSAQKYWGTTPDMACFSKAMANGFPISVICGKTDLMKVLEADCFVSSTFGADLVSIAAAISTIEEIETKNVITHIWQTGEKFKEGFNSLALNMEVDAKCEGLPCRTRFVFPSENHLKLFWKNCLANGVLFGKAQFISFSHGQEELDITFNAMRAAFRILKKYWEKPELGI